MYCVACSSFHAALIIIYYQLRNQTIAQLSTGLLLLLLLNTRVNLLTLDWLFPLEVGAVITTTDGGALLCYSK